jgi:hypothetical protein
MSLLSLCFNRQLMSPFQRVAQSKYFRSTNKYQKNDSIISFDFRPPWIRIFSNWIHIPHQLDAFIIDDVWSDVPKGGSLQPVFYIAFLRNINIIGSTLLISLSTKMVKNYSMDPYNDSRVCPPIIFKDLWFLWNFRSFKLKRRYMST